MPSYKDFRIRMTLDFSTATLEAKRKTRVILQILKKREFPT